MANQEIQFCSIKNEPSFSVVDRLLQIARDRYENKFGSRVLNYLIYPRMLCLYLAHLMPVETRCEVIQFLLHLQQKGARHFLWGGRTKGKPGQRYRFRIRREVQRKLEKMKLGRADQEASILVSDQSSERISEFIFKDDRMSAYGIY